MKAVVVRAFGEPEVLKVETVADPTPGAGQVLVEVKAVGVNPVETYRRSGKYASLPPLPWTPGTDAGGVVRAVGAGVTKVKPGDRVYTGGSLSGTYAELALCPEAAVHPLPDPASFAQGAALGVPYATAVRALFQLGKAKAGETVLVHGASGGVGLAAVQLAKAAGLTVLGTAGTLEGEALVTGCGAAYALDHGAAGYLDRIMELTGGKGVHLIMEMAAHLNLGKDLTVLAPQGRVIIVGSRGPVEVNPRDLMSREAFVQGVLLFATPAPEMAEIHARLRAGLSDGSLKPVIAKELPLAQAAQAHRDVMSPGARGKIVLLP